MNCHEKFNALAHNKSDLNNTMKTFNCIKCLLKKSTMKRLLTFRRDMPSPAGIVTEPNCSVHLWVSPGICTRPRARTWQPSRSVNHKTNYKLNELHTHTHTSRDTRISMHLILLQEMQLKHLLNYAILYMSKINKLIN